jgi:uncharacterized protein YndB with AHSA1/START domain
LAGPVDRREASAMKAIATKPLDWISRAPVSVTSSRRISASPERVWDAIADHERWPEWFSPVTKVEVLGRGEGIGGRRRVHIGRVSVEEEFLAWEPGRRFAFTVTHARWPGLKAMVEDVRLEPDGTDATTVTYTQALEPAGAAVLGPVLRRALPRALGRGLAGLDRHVTG